MVRRCPVVTGVGAISAAGCGADAIWGNVLAGRSGLGPLDLFASPRYGRHPVGQVREDVDRFAGAVRGSRTDKLAWIATQQALDRAGWQGLAGEGALRPGRVGVLLGSTVGGMLGTERVVQQVLMQGRRRFGPLRFHPCATVAGLCASRTGARGSTAVFSTACSAAAMAIAAAAELIESGELDLAIAGGADSLCRMTLNGFGSLLLLDPDGCRPFDATRAGISLGEGAAILILEAEETARERGGAFLARLSGWGASCDASHATAPHPQGDGAHAAMNAALDRAGLSPADIDFVSAHGTGTLDNDLMEGLALRRLFGDRVPPVSSFMRVFGHTLGASGAVKAVVCVQALAAQAVPPSPGFENPDARVGLAPPKKPCAKPLRHILSNSFGFGGNNVVLVFSRPEITDPCRPHPPRPDGACAGSVAVAGSACRRFLAVLRAGVVSPAGHTLAAVADTFHHGGAKPVPTAIPAPLGPAEVPAYSCGGFGADELLPAARRRKLGRLQQMVLVAARRALLEDVPLSTARVCVAVGTGLGCLADTGAFVENLFLQDERSPLPTRFSNSVHNACAAQLAIEFGLTGLNSTPTCREISFEVALWQCAQELVNGRARLAVAGAADELHPFHMAAGLRWGWWHAQAPSVRPFSALSGRLRPLAGEGAALFALALGTGGAEPIAHVTGVAFGRSDRNAQGQLDPQREAEWIQATLRLDGLSLDEVDLLLTGANGLRRKDQEALEVAERLSRLAGRRIPAGAYKHCCGEHDSASAFGFLTAIGLVRGEITPAACLLAEGCGETPHSRAGNRSSPPPKGVVLYTLGAGGSRAMCHVCA